MSLDLSTIGFKTEPHAFSYDWKTTVLYALGIGAKRAELDYLYEGRGPKVFPTFGVIPAYGPVSELFAKTRCDMTRLVHGAQTLRIHRPLPPCATQATSAGHAPQRARRPKSRRARRLTSASRRPPSRNRRCSIGSPAI